MCDDLSWIESSYSSVAEYNRCMSEGSAADYYNDLWEEKVKEEIEKSDDTVRKWKVIYAWDIYEDNPENILDHLLTEKEKNIDEYHEIVIHGDMYTYKLADESEWEIKEEK